METDVLVLGGGLPGVCAAIQAANDGAEVVLVERGMTLGGNCGPEVGIHASDGHRFHPYAASTGVVGKLIEDAAFVGAKTRSANGHYNISQQWDTVLAQALKDAGVKLLRRHYAHTPDVADNKITAVICEDTATCRRVRVNVRAVVVEASGDGNVAALAGAEFRTGREARAEFGERSAPEVADDVTLGASLVSLIRRTDREVPFIKPPGTPPFHPGYAGMFQWVPRDKDSLIFFFPTETGGEDGVAGIIENEHELYDRLLGHLYSAWNRLKNEINVPEWRNWELAWVSPRVAKRESRRFMGDHILTQTDVESGRLFDDAIAMGGFAVDVHDPRPENREYVKVVFYGIPPQYGIPYRSIYSRNIANLLFASRLLSVTHMAHGTTRLQRTLACVGQAAGAAAAMCKKRGLAPREIFTKGLVPELQQILLRDDATIPGVAKNDPADRAPLAQISATSETPYGVSGEPSCWLELDVPRGADLWDFTDRLDRVSFLLRNEGPEKTLRAEAFRFKPDVKDEFLHRLALHPLILKDAIAEQPD